MPIRGNVVRINESSIARYTAVSPPLKSKFRRATSAQLANMNLGVL